MGDMSLPIGYVGIPVKEYEALIRSNQDLDRIRIELYEAKGELNTTRKDLMKYMDLYDMKRRELEEKEKEEKAADELREAGSCENQT